MPRRIKGMVRALEVIIEVVLIAVFIGYAYSCVSGDVPPEQWLS
jgi:hypothetical protein